MKKIMMLGGNLVQTTAIKAAKDEGYYVITVDYLPENPGHAFADEYYNISTIDKEAVLAQAKKCKIDGIVSYASDVSAPTAAYVAERMNLPTNSYEAVITLTNKDLFRKFMLENGFDTPEWGVFSDFDQAYDFIHKVGFPMILKPVDASGSKGVNKVVRKEQLLDCWHEAKELSREGKVLAERFIEGKGYQIDGDIFVEHGKICFNGLCDQHHDFSCAPYTPIGLSFPSIQELHLQEKALNIISCIFEKLHIKMGAFNIEYLVDSNGGIHIIEIGPRNGGNLITDVIYKATDINLAKYTVRQAVGEACLDLTQDSAKRYACSYVIHSLKDGVFDSLYIDSVIKNNIIFCKLTVKKGEKVTRFRNASQGIGMMVLSFDSGKKMLEVIDNMNLYVQVKVR